MRTLSITTGWFVSTSSYSVDIQRWAKANEWGLAVWGSWQLSWYSLVSRVAVTRLLVARRVPEISQHDMQTSFNISQLYPPSSLLLLNLLGAILFVYSTLPYSCGKLLASNSLRAQ